MRVPSQKTIDVCFKTALPRSDVRYDGAAGIPSISSRLGLVAPWPVADAATAGDIHTKGNAAEGGETVYFEGWALNCGCRQLRRRALRAAVVNESNKML